jgi:PIN domain nuclease of toxin-antitoxin system
MKLLLDTHALLWILRGDSRLSTSAREAYREADEVWFSMVSLWEIGIKAGLKRKDFVLASDWFERIPRACTEQGIQRVNVEPAHCGAVSLLPLHHRDPFDRLLVVQANALRAGLLSCDRKLDAYDVTLVW